MKTAEIQSQSIGTGERDPLNRVRNVALTVSGLALAGLLEVGSMEETRPLVDYSLATLSVMSGTVAAVCQLLKRRS